MMGSMSHPNPPQGFPVPPFELTGAGPSSFGVQLFSPKVEGAAGGPAVCRPRTAMDGLGEAMCLAMCWAVMGATEF